MARALVALGLLIAVLGLRATSRRRAELASADALVESLAEFPCVDHVDRSPVQVATSSAGAPAVIAWREMRARARSAFVPRASRPARLRPPSRRPVPSSPRASSRAA